MEGKLIEWGDDVALVLDRSMLDQLNITLDTPLDVSVEGQGISIMPIYKEASPDDIKETLERVNRRYGRALKRLAE
ncbi:MAG TPA: AbrB/MazE/SpoVT family DNA-binding domain-containing protein [Chloroflexia bacterium]|nr:AbrB/MazE/SpoVT family DNA-binding domain-containing protein [Chloroflexia bacterium]